MVDVRKMCLRKIFSLLSLFTLCNAVTNRNGCDEISKFHYCVSHCLIDHVYYSDHFCTSVSTRFLFLLLEVKCPFTTLSVTIC